MKMGGAILLSKQKSSQMVPLLIRKYTVMTVGGDICFDLVSVQHISLPSVLSLPFLVLEKTKAGCIQYLINARN